MILRAQLNVFNGAKEAALFSVAYTLMEIVFMFVSTITATLSPYFFAQSKSDNKSSVFYNIMLKYSIVCIMLIVPFIFVLRYDVILLAASEKYIQAGDYIPLLILFPLLRVLIGVFQQYYLKASDTLFLGITYIVTIFLCFIISIFLIPKYSAFGAIGASLISYAFLFICLCLRKRGIVDFEYMRFSALLKMVLILWTTVFVLSFFEFPNVYKIFPLGISALLSLFLLPVLNDQEKNQILILLKIKFKE